MTLHREVHRVEPSTGQADAVGGGAVESGRGAGVRQPGVGVDGGGVGRTGPPGGAQLCDKDRGGRPRISVSGTAT